jgi:hypothetical protein
MSAVLRIEEWPLACSFIRNRKIRFTIERKLRMKYLIAWGLGVPGVLIVIWFLINHH